MISTQLKMYALKKNYLTTQYKILIAVLLSFACFLEKNTTNFSWASNFSALKNLPHFVNMLSFIQFFPGVVDCKSYLSLQCWAWQKVHPLTWWLRIFAISFVSVDSFLSVFLSEILCTVLFVLTFDSSFKFWYYCFSDS